MTRTRRLSMLAATAALALTAAGCGSGGTTPATSPTPSTPSTLSPTTSAPTGPSQTPAAAKRDGVIPALARLPFNVRVDIQAEVATEHGVWVLSRPSPQAKKYAKGCRIGPETGRYPTDTICTTEYGEVLLLDGTKTHIVRAYPLPAVPPTFLRVTPTAVYCGRQGDLVPSETALPDSMLCRIDRTTLQAAVRVFYSVDSQVHQPCFYPPKNWTVTKGKIRMTDLQVDNRGVWAKGATGTWTKFDLQTLQIAGRNLTR